MIFKCLECEILKFRKPLIGISESRVLFCFENEIPKIRKWFSNVLNKSFRKSENHFRNIRKTYSSRIRRLNAENKKPICYISDIIFSISEINNHILRKLKTNILFQNFPKCHPDFKKLFTFVLTFTQIRKFFSDIPKIFSFFMNTILSSPNWCKEIRIDYWNFSKQILRLVFYNWFYNKEKRV